MELGEFLYLLLQNNSLREYWAQTGGRGSRDNTLLNWMVLNIRDRLFVVEPIPIKSEPPPPQPG